MNLLKIKCWGDNNDSFDCGIYIIIDDVGIHYESQWYDSASLFKDKNAILEIKQEIHDFCNSHGLYCDLSTTDYHDWSVRK